ncbi:isoprenylcysteine carboxylmethyltransferase family protein [Devosia sp. 63-57]|uniref:methyltransferase family protein n=1 Tax=Devosia sp. 63-57 TaxID=1895751 RepID=UPI0008696C28|nr:isoprenylcysteine carboxylmethyltransferase family protein [Devosia sp. 63-57]ODT50018.1 MAG: hypothetical protein ABS74_05895 [Pelagibacterium sp. SCN 63-126]ODU85874.1 MAG: hypothetical protein ABT14_10850 [Pelagibacterium sp. SCN 63-17]OJX45299.1 MAG: hypothetical protein BGO80_05620 [Devosia sp. 63-57]
MEKDNPGLIMPPPFYPALSWLAALGLQWLHPLHLIPPFGLSSWAFWLGLLLAVAGFAVVNRAIAAFQAAGTNVMPSQPTLVVVSTGPYRFSRNPIYIGCLMLHLGLTLMAGLNWGLPLLPLVLVAFHLLAVLPEERYLQRKFGDSYTRYQAATRRWL